MKTSIFVAESADSYCTFVPDLKKKYKTAADRAAADSDRCRAQNYKNTEMNESRPGRHSSIRFRQVHRTELQKHEDEREQIRQTADRAAADSCRQQPDSRSRFRQTEQTDACRRNHPNNIQATGTIRY
ncbi:hypothetical protein Tco_1039720 [Tanacetum coccineum]